MDKVLGAIAALVGVSVFSTGFLSVRLHAQRGRGRDRLQRVDERILDGKQVTEMEAERAVTDHVWSWEPDEVVLLTIRLNVAIAFACIFIAVIGGLHQPWTFSLDPRRIVPEFWILLVVCSVELGVVWLGLADIRWLKEDANYLGGFGVIDSPAAGYRVIQDRLNHAWYEQAQLECGAALRVAPYWIPLLSLTSIVHLATFLSRNEETDRTLALAYAERATRVSDKNGQAAYNRAEVLIRLNQFKEAEPLLIKAIQLETNVDAAYHNLGAIYLECERYDEAIEQFQAALATPKEDPLASDFYRVEYTYWNRAVAFKAKGDVAQSNRDYAAVQLREQILQEETRQGLRPSVAEKQPTHAVVAKFVFRPLPGVDIPGEPFEKYRRARTIDVLLQAFIPD